jgi:hypothetical protein
MEMHVAGFTYDEIAAKLGIGRARVNHLIREANAAIQAEQARITGSDVPRSRRAARLSALEHDPPAWLVSAIGASARTTPSRRSWHGAGPRWRLTTTGGHTVLTCGSSRSAADRATRRPPARSTSRPGPPRGRTRSELTGSNGRGEPDGA